MTIYERLKDGLPLSDTPVIDEHCHLEYYCGGYQPKGTAADIVAVMDKLGVSISCISHCGAFVDQRYGNDRVAAALAEYPTRFVGYCTINPLYPDEAVNELDRCFGMNGFKGIKLHPWCHERPMSSVHYKKVYEYAARHNRFIMSHTYTPDDVETTGRLADEFPDTIFIMAHLGGYFPCFEQAVAVLNRHPNVYGDISGSESREGFVEWLVREAGPKQILFGTDMCCMDGRATLAMIAAAEMPDGAKADILGLNMRRILDTCA